MWSRKFIIEGFSERFYYYSQGLGLNSKFCIKGKRTFTNLPHFFLINFTSVVSAMMLSIDTKRKEKVGDIIASSYNVDLLQLFPIRRYKLWFLVTFILTQITNFWCDPNLKFISSGLNFIWTVTILTKMVFGLAFKLDK